MNACFRSTAIGVIGVSESRGALTGLCFGDFSLIPGGQPVETPLQSEAFSQLGAWLAGGRTLFDLPLAPSGTGFMLRVWTLLQEIPYGQTRTYREIAARAGSPGAARAVGAACAKNPLPIFIPCHRVVCSDGSPGGYLGGSGIKCRLLDLERRNSC